MRRITNLERFAAALRQSVRLMLPRGHPLAGGARRDVDSRCRQVRSPILVVGLARRPSRVARCFCIHRPRSRSLIRLTVACGLHGRYRRAALSWKHSRSCDRSTGRFGAGRTIPGVQAESGFGADNRSAERAVCETRCLRNAMLPDCLHNAASTAILSCDFGQRPS